MALSDRYKKSRQDVISKREQLALERAQNSVAKFMETEQFKLSAFALPEGQMAVDAIVRNTVHTTLDPTGEFLDTLHAKGFRPAEVRKMVSRLYVTYIQSLDGSEQQLPPYEDMLHDVSIYVGGHQEIYNTLDPESLRG